MFFQGARRHFNVIKGNCVIAEFLVLFVTLACD
jgi:hypothetical protein